MSNKAGPPRKLSTASNSTLEGNAASRRSSIGSYANLGAAAAAPEHWGYGSNANAAAAANREWKNANANLWSKELDAETEKAVVFTANLVNEHFKVEINKIRQVEFLDDLTDVIYESEEHMAALRTLVAIEGDLYKNSSEEVQTLFCLFASAMEKGEQGPSSRKAKGTRRRIQHGGVNLRDITAVVVTATIGGYVVGVGVDWAQGNPLHVALGSQIVNAPVEMVGAAGEALGGVLKRMHSKLGYYLGQKDEMVSNELYEMLKGGKLPIEFADWAGPLRINLGMHLRRGVELSSAFQDVRQTMIGGLIKFKATNATFVSEATRLVTTSIRTTDQQYTREMGTLTSQFRNAARLAGNGLKHGRYNNPLKVILEDPSIDPLTVDLANTLAEAAKGGWDASPVGWEMVTGLQTQIKVRHDAHTQTSTFLHEVQDYLGGRRAEADLTPGTLRFLCAQAASASHVTLDRVASPHRIVEGAPPLSVIPFPPIPSGSRIIGPLLASVDHSLFAAEGSPLSDREEASEDARSFTTAIFAYDALQETITLTLQMVNASELAFHAEQSTQRDGEVQSIVHESKRKPSAGALRPE
jgi:hypothetical protein